MPLTEENKVDRMEILEDGQIQVRRARIIRDELGNEITRTFHREVLDPGRAEDRTREVDPTVQRVRDAAWTPEVVTEREATLEASRDRLPPTER